MENSMTSSWILNVIEPRLRTRVAYISITKAMWDTLKERYTIANVPKIYLLKTSIANCKQGGLSVVVFHSKITDLGVELKNHDSIPGYTCNTCKCGAMNKILQKYQQVKAHQLPIGLNDDMY